ncbi:hypothetical protein K435DRAFT_688800, partial [Dendrothele bispora CBS 962.96]
ISPCPGHALLLFHPSQFLGQMLANMYPFPGWIGHYFDNFSMYNRYKSACISSVLITDSRPIFWLADAHAIKTVATDKTTFDKDIDLVNFIPSPTFLFTFLHLPVVRKRS